MKNNHFICPVCRSKLQLSENGGSLICQKETKPHCFDISAAGYVNLDRSHAGGGDSKECVRSRSAFLELGYYSPISEIINETVRNILLSESVLIDAGCGEGYYTSALAEALPETKVYGIDISKPAIEHGAKRARRKGFANNLYAVSSIFDLPFPDESVDCITGIFAPCPENEFYRVLRKDGYLVIVAAGKKHLLGLKNALYENVYMNEERSDLPDSSGFELIKKETLSYSITLKSAEEIANLFSMTPYYYRTSITDKEKLNSLSSLETEVEIDLSIYRKN